ncbi:hypothetical protein MXD63_43355, partial [Frankia sp. Cpl3]|nr:hypothetical protein [Frankia sp. Cpl3]
MANAHKQENMKATIILPNVGAEAANSATRLVLEVEDSEVADSMAVVLEVANSEDEVSENLADPRFSSVNLLSSLE